MPQFATSAILLRRLDYGDKDLILTLLTRDRGKLSAIAKSAKKSVKRFSGVLELFSVLRIVLHDSRRGTGMPVLQEAAIEKPFAGIRSDFMRTAYACYWSELVHGSVEKGDRQEELYRLCEDCLTALDAGEVSPPTLSILFQVRFVTLSGYGPRLDACGTCRTPLERTAGDRFQFDCRSGWLHCPACAGIGGRGGALSLSRGTIKQLQWAQQRPLGQALRVRFGAVAETEGLAMLETFLPFHLNREPKSLAVLRQMRRGAMTSCPVSCA